MVITQKHEYKYTKYFRKDLCFMLYVLFHHLLYMHNVKYVLKQYVDRVWSLGLIL